MGCVGRSVGVAVSAVRLARQVEKVSEAGAKGWPSFQRPILAAKEVLTCWVALPCSRAELQRRLALSASFGDCSPPGFSVVTQRPTELTERRPRIRFWRCEMVVCRVRVVEREPNMVS